MNFVCYKSLRGLNFYDTIKKGCLEILEKFPVLCNYQHNPIKAKEFFLKIKNNIFINEQKFDQNLVSKKDTNHPNQNNLFVYKYIINNLINIVKINDIEKKELVFKTPHTTVYKSLYLNIEYLFFIQDNLVNDFFQLITHETLQQYYDHHININKSFVFDNNKIIGFICILPQGEFLNKRLDNFDLRAKLFLIRKLMKMIFSEDCLVINFEIESIYVVERNSEIEDLIILNRQTIGNSKDQENISLKRKAIFKVLGSILLNYETPLTENPDDIDNLLTNFEKLVNSSLCKEKIKNLLKEINDSNSINSLFQKLERMIWCIYESSIDNLNNNLLNIENVVTSFELVSIKNSNNNLVNVEKVVTSFELIQKRSYDVRMKKEINLYLISELIDKKHENQILISELLRLQREGEYNYSIEEYDISLKNYEQVLEMKRKLLGDEDRETGIAYANLAGVLLKLGQFKKSHVLYNKALNIYEKYHGNENLLIASVLSNIAMTYELEAEYQTALDCYFKSLDIKLKIFGENNSSTASSFNNIARMYELLGNHKDSYIYHQKALDIYNELNGEINVDSARIYNSIGLIYTKVLKYEEAIACFKKCIDISISCPEDNRALTATSYNNLGLVLYNKGEYDESIKCFNYSIDIRKKIHGPYHPDTASSFNNMAGAFFKKEEFNIALENYIICLNINKKILGVMNSDTGTVYNNIGLVYVKLKNYELAFDNFKNSLNIREIIKKSHPDTVSTLNNLAGVVYKMNLFNNCIELYLKSLDIMTELNENNVLEFINIHKNLGHCYLNTDQIELSIAHYEKALAKAKAHLGVSNIITSECYFNLGVAYESIDDNENSLEMFQKSFEIRKKNLGENHTETMLVEEKIYKIQLN